MTEKYSLRERRVRLGLSQEKLCEIAGLSRPHYAEVESGRKPLTDKMRTKLEQAFEFVEQDKDKSGQAQTTDADDAPSSATPDLIQVTRRIPVVGMAAAAMFDPALSQLCDLWDASDETVPCAIQQEGIFALRIQGDSMEPTLRDGDVVAVDPNALPATGDLAVVCLRTDGLVIKRWYWRRGIVRLESLNPDGKTYEWTKDEVFQQGLILWRWKVLGLLWRKLS